MACPGTPHWSQASWTKPSRSSRKGSQSIYWSLNCDCSYSCIVLPVAFFFQVVLKECPKSSEIDSSDVSVNVKSLSGQSGSRRHSPASGETKVASLGSVSGIWISRARLNVWWFEISRHKPGCGSPFTGSFNQTWIGKLLFVHCALHAQSNGYFTVAHNEFYCPAGLWFPICQSIRIENETGMAEGQSSGVAPVKTHVMLCKSLQDLSILNAMPVAFWGSLLHQQFIHKTFALQV